MKRTIKLALAAALVAVSAYEGVGTFAGFSGLNLVSQAHATVGRPLTPVSVAGVARRTSRRN